MLIHKQQIDELIANGYSEQSIAKRAKISQSTINRIRTGQTRSPKYETRKILKKVCDELLSKLKDA